MGWGPGSPTSHVASETGLMLESVEAADALPAKACGVGSPMSFLCPSPLLEAVREAGWAAVPRAVELQWGQDLPCWSPELALTPHPHPMSPQKEGHFTLHSRAILEMEQYIREMYPEAMKVCNICHGLLIQVPHQLSPHRPELHRAHEPFLQAAPEPLDTVCWPLPVGGVTAAQPVPQFVPFCLTCPPSGARGPLAPAGPGTCLSSGPTLQTLSSAACTSGCPCRSVGPRRPPPPRSG